MNDSKTAQQTASETDSSSLAAIETSQIDADALRTIERLTRYGYQAYLCGGGVRDLLLGRTPKDFDIATNAHPGEIRKLFRNCRIIGRRFRLAHVYFPGGKILEVSTFRATNEFALEAMAGGEEGQGEVRPEAATGAGERGAPTTQERELLITDDNTFGTAETDARRRDFTINGLFYDVIAGRVIDHVDGLADAERRLIRTIGDPSIRFREDPVRMLRAVKFAGRLECTIEAETLAALKAHTRELRKAAPPRVLLEVSRMLGGGAAESTYRMLDETGLLEVILPDVAEFVHRCGSDAEGELFWHLLATLDQVRREGVAVEEAVLLAVLFAPMVHRRATDIGVDPDSHHMQEVVDEVLASFAGNSAITKRIKARIREIFGAQRRLREPTKNPGQLRRLMQRDYFPDALAFFQIYCRAFGRNVGIEFDPEQDGPEANHPPRKRRRRGGGARRPRAGAREAGQGGGEGGGGTGGGSSEPCPWVSGCCGVRPDAIAATHLTDISHVQLPQ